MNVFFQLALTALVALCIVSVTINAFTDHTRPAFFNGGGLVVWVLLALGCLHWIWS